MAFAWTLENTLPPSIAGLLLAAAVGSVMSGADSFLLAGATSFVNDLYIPFRGGKEQLSEKHLVLVTRLTIFVFGIGAALVALSGISIIAINTLGMGIMSVLFAGIVAMLWSGTKRKAGLPGFIVGGVTFGIWQFGLGEPELFGQGTLESAVPATLAALITIIGISYFLEGENIDVDLVREEAADDMKRISEEDLSVGNSD
jgi:SSS family solute:Na+ symporter